MAAPALPGALLSPMLANAQPQAAAEQWYWYPGHTFTFKAIAKDTGGTSSWMLVENSPREGVPFHKHLHEDESFFVIDGHFEITVGETTITGGPGTYMYGPKNVPHRWTNVGSTRGRVLSVFTPAGLEQHFLTIGHPVDSSSQQLSIDVNTMNPQMAALRQKFGIVRTGPTKYDRLGDPSVSAPK